ncbi:hypothetical protein CBL_21381, partial [Carabus blaptoides fortunei]
MANSHEEFRIPKLSSDNYHAWSIRTRAALVQKSCWEAIGPDFRDMTNEERKINNKALKFLIYSCRRQPLGRYRCVFNSQGGVGDTCGYGWRSYRTSEKNKLMNFKPASSIVEAANKDKMQVREETDIGMIDLVERPHQNDVIVHLHDDPNEIEKERRNPGHEANSTQANQPDVGELPRLADVNIPFRRSERFAARSQFQN